MKIKISLLVLFISILLYIGNNLINLFIHQKPITSFSNDSCIRRNVKSKGPEDITFFNKDYLITATSNMVEIWYKFDDQKNIKSGEIILIPVNEKEELIFLSKTNLPPNYKLHAHGIYIKDNLLYIINHGYKYGGERLDIFLIDVEGKKAVFTKSFQFPNELYGITNDLIAIDDENFFVTSWNTFVHDENGMNEFKFMLSNLIQFVLQLQTTYVYHCSFSTSLCKRLENTSGMMNNGITWNHDLINPIVYVADSMKKIKEYKILKSNQGFSFSLQRTFDIDYLIDNIEYSKSDNRIYISLIGNINEYFSFVDSLKEHKRLPDFDVKYNSGIGYIDLDNGSFKVLRFTNLIRVGSSVYAYNSKYYFGSFADDSILVCNQ